MTGTLYVVGTPIGNLGDVTARAAEVLRSVDVIACEDTRRTSVLLRHVGVAGISMVVLNEHTEPAATGRLVGAVLEGRSVALVSDAGMPTVSDPGRLLVGAAQEAGARVEVVPGPSALVAALAVAGIPADRFCFEGFLPRKGTERRARLFALRDEPRAVVLFEAPHRLARTLSDLVAVVGPEREVAICRELTKVHEEVWRGPLGDAVARPDEPRGEHVLVLAGAPAAGVVGDDEVLRLLREELDRGASRRDAIAAVAAGTGLARGRVYDLALSLPAP